MRIDLCIGDARLTISGERFDIQFGPAAGDATPEAPEANSTGGIPASANASHTGVTGGESAATISNPKAKASEDNAVTSPTDGVDGPGDASRPSVGGGSDAPIRRMSMTPLEPRERGGLKGFGFTVNFDDTPSSSPLLPTVETKAAGAPPPAPAATNRWAALRPHCKNPDMCGGFGRKHCNPCAKDAPAETARAA